MTVRLERDSGGGTVTTSRYVLVTDGALPYATVTDVAGAAPVRLALLADVAADGGFDTTMSHGGMTVDETADSVTLTFEQRSTSWTEKRIRLRCTDEDVAFTVEVRGTGRLGDVRLLGGTFTGNPRWGGGRYHSAWRNQTLFSPSPDDPGRIVTSASEPATIGVVGNSLPGRGHWFFTPAPFLFGGHPSADASATGAHASPWQTFELRGGIEGATFTEFRYAPFIGGFSFELAYEGQTAVDGRFETPALVFRPVVDDPYRALADHADSLRAAGDAPRRHRDRPAWWTRPIFCGWGEQCRTAQLEGGLAATYARQDRYDSWLATLAAHDIHPGTVVIDDKWQTTYGRNEVDEERWPDLRRWIGDRHGANQRVLLWFKAWDAEGLADAACVTDPLGHRVAADPGSGAYRDIVRETMDRLLGAGGFDADGLKIDFTAQTPSGAGLRHAGQAWGVALLHELLALIHDAARAAKPDALIVTHTPSPLFTDVTDMIRLNDLMRLDDPDPVVPAVAQMTHRARVVASIEPGMLIDTDDWCMPSKREWRAYLAAKPDLGVPALYYATGIDYSGEAFDEADYAAIRDAWSEYEARRVQGIGR